MTPLNSIIDTIHPKFLFYDPSNSYSYFQLGIIDYIGNNIIDFDIVDSFLLNPLPHFIVYSITRNREPDTSHGYDTHIKFHVGFFDDIHTLTPYMTAYLQMCQSREFFTLIDFFKHYQTDILLIAYQVLPHEEDKRFIKQKFLKNILS